MKVLHHKLGDGIKVRGATQIGPHWINPDHWDWDQVGQNPFFCPDAEAVPLWERLF